MIQAIERLSAHVILTSARSRAVYAFLAGALSALAMPPFHLFAVLFLTFPILVWLMDSATSEPETGLISKVKPAFMVGWWFGFGYFLAGLWWIGNAFLVEAEDFAWALPFAVIALPALLAIFWALAAAVARIFWRDDWRRILALAAAFSLAELARGTLLTGFPWNALGYAATPIPIAMQSVSVVGIYGLGFVAVFVFAAPGVLTPDNEGQRRGVRITFLIAIAMVVAHLGYGQWRLGQASSDTVEGVSLRLVQPSVNQNEKWAPEKEAEIFGKLLSLSKGSGEASAPLDEISYLIWPESAFPFFLTERSDALSAIGDLLPDETQLITGAARVEPPVSGRSEAFVFNSVYVIDPDGEISGASDKVHLVPFGEYLPFQAFAESIGLEQLTRLRGGFEAGNTIRTLETRTAGSFLPQICYEIIFPGKPVYSGPQPGWIVNVTNDAWFGKTPGPYQHHFQSVLRGVETGLPVVRVANSGISSVSDPYGRTIVKTRLGEATSVDSRLPVALANTPYMTFGNLPLIVLCILAFGWCIIPARSHTRF